MEFYQLAILFGAVCLLITWLGYVFADSRLGGTTNRSWYGYWNGDSRCQYDWWYYDHEYLEDHSCGDRFDGDHD